MSANCEYFEGLMSRMLDGDLHPAETDALREHIRGCKSCRTLCAAFSGMTLSLRDDLVEPPVSAADTVMSRIRAYEAEKALETDPPAPETPTLPRRTEKKASAPRRPRWVPTAVAACLVLVMGAGALTLRGGKTASEAAIQNESAMFSRAGEAQVYGASEAMEAAPEEAESDGTVVMVAADTAVAVADTETDAGTNDDPAAADLSGYTLSAPATVPAGRESDFEALLSDAGTMGTGPFQVICYVEYRGVIYEFMTDESQSLLLWRDAAEGFPAQSRSDFSALTDILQE